MKENFTSILNNFDKVIAEKATFLYNKHNEPLDQNQILSLLESHNIYDEELVELYSWKNGIFYNPIEYTILYDYSAEGVILPLEYASSLCNPDDGYHLWKKNFFPIIGNYGGDFLLYNSDSKSKTHKMIFLYSKSALSLNPMYSYFDSVSAMLMSITECFNSNVFQYNENSGLDINIEAWTGIIRGINTKSTYWKQ
ncbi:SMI1/KNR4 family protein [Chitinophaga silvatica]|nr:SMI1/KNR4 family protein [Chitinophaga silvatica]